MFIEYVNFFHLNCTKLVLGTLETLAKQKKQQKKNDKNFTSIYLRNKYVILLPLNHAKLLLKILFCYL